MFERVQRKPKVASCCNASSTSWSQLLTFKAASVTVKSRGSTEHGLSLRGCQSIVVSIERGVQRCEEKPLLTHLARGSWQTALKPHFCWSCMSDLLYPAAETAYETGSVSSTSGRQSKYPCPSSWKVLQGSASTEKVRRRFPRRAR